MGSRFLNLLSFLDFPLSLPDLSHLLPRSCPCTPTAILVSSMYFLPSVLLAHYLTHCLPFPSPTPSLVHWFDHLLSFSNPPSWPPLTALAGTGSMLGYYNDLLHLRMPLLCPSSQGSGKPQSQSNLTLCWTYWIETHSHDHWAHVKFITVKIRWPLWAAWQLPSPP